MAFFKEMRNPAGFGVPVFDTSGKRIVMIEEKPKEPKSELAQTGFYIFDSTVFSIIKTLKPSARGELEITDVNNVYIKKKKLTFAVVRGDWSDAGTFDALLGVSIKVAKYAA